MQFQNIQCLFDNLSDDAQSDIRTREIIHGETSLWAAELKSGKKLPAHYHTHGSEIYQVLDGEGTIEYGKLLPDGSVSWEHPRSLQPGDILKITPSMVHRLLGGSQDLSLIFFTPPSHLAQDRFLIDA